MHAGSLAAGMLFDLGWPRRARYHRAMNNPRTPQTEVDVSPVLRLAGLILAAPLIWLVVAASSSQPVPALIVYILLVLFACRLAVRKGYSFWVGLVLGAAIPPLGWLIAGFLPRTAAGRKQDRLEFELKRELAEAGKTLRCPDCGRPNSAKSRICARCERRLAEPRKIAA